MELKLFSSRKRLESMVTKTTLVMGGFVLGVLTSAHGQSGNYDHARNLVQTAAIPLTTFPLIDRYIGNLSFKDAYWKASYIAPGYLVGQYFSQMFR